MSARIAALKSLLAAVAVFAAAATLAGPASANVRTFKAARTHGHTAVFKLRGIDGPSVRSAYLKVGSRRRKLPLRRVRRGVSRGVLRTRTPRGSRPRAHRPRLHVRIAARVDTGFSPYAGGYTVPAGARHVSPGGSDGDPGTAAEPWRTVDHAAEEAGPGDTVVVHPGSYSQPGRITRLSRSGRSSAPVVFVGEPGRLRPRLMGQLRIEGDHVQVRGLLVDGPTGPVADRRADNPDGEDLNVWITGADTVLEDSEVRDSLWHAGVYVSDGASEVRVVRNRIHHNGDFGDPRQANLDHGVYWAAGSGVVADNVIDHNLAYGVTLYPSASNVVVARNKISGHGKGGVLISERSRRNQIVDNLIARNRLGINTWELTGAGNVARGNRLRGNWEGNLGETQGLVRGGDIRR